MPEELRRRADLERVRAARSDDSELQEWHLLRARQFEARAQAKPKRT
jgi:hypothetical protein